MAVKAHIAIAMIDNHQQAETAHPVGKSHPSLGNRATSPPSAASIITPRHFRPALPRRVPKRFARRPPVGQRSFPFKVLKGRCWVASAGMSTSNSCSEETSSCNCCSFVFSRLNLPPWVFSSRLNAATACLRACFLSFSRSDSRCWLSRKLSALGFLAIDSSTS